MDFKKIKDIAKTAIDKTAEGLNKANDMRKKAALETKITLPASVLYLLTIIPSAFLRAGS